MSRLALPQLQEQALSDLHVSQLVHPALQGREKIALIKRFTAMGFNILVSDIDTVWLRDPLPYMAQYPQADILMSSDNLVSLGLHSLSCLHEWAMHCSQLGMQPSMYATGRLRLLAIRWAYCCILVLDACRALSKDTRLCLVDNQSPEHACQAVGQADYAGQTTYAAAVRRHAGSHHTGCSTACHSEPACLLQHETAVDGGLEHFPEAGAAANIGILMFRVAGHNLAEVKPSYPSAAMASSIQVLDVKTVDIMLTMLLGSLRVAHPDKTHHCETARLMCWHLLQQL